MEALASIAALAAARLDKVEEERIPSAHHERIGLVHNKPPPVVMTGMAPPLLPPRQTFGSSDSLRVVSEDSTTTDQSSPELSPSPQVALSMSLEPVISRVSADEADDVPTDPDSKEGLFLLRSLGTRNDDLPPPPSPDEVIASVQENDVLCGRGGETNHHPGNVRYRALVKKFQLLYLKAKRRDKPKIARLIVEIIRKRAGRFLKKDAAGNTWRDVGNSKAREKTSQALREGAPELRNGQPPKSKNDSKKRRRESASDQLVGISSIVTPTLSSCSPDSQCVVTLQQNIVNGLPSVPICDDDDGSSFQLSPSSPSKKQKQIRGPRLRILKARLQDDESTE